MPRLRVGKDEIRFREEHREAAEVARRTASRESRARGEELVQVSAPSVRILISTERPRTPDILRFTPHSLYAVTLAASVLLLLAAVMDIPILVVLGAYAFIFLAHAIPWCRWVKSIDPQWPILGGFALRYYPLLSSLIAIKWPPGGSEISAKFVLPLTSRREALLMVLAHEYGHVLLHTHYQANPPMWVSEGFAHWFAEQLVGRQLFAA